MKQKLKLTLVVATVIFGIGLLHKQQWLTTIRATLVTDLLKTTFITSAFLPTPIHGQPNRPLLQPEFFFPTAINKQPEKSAVHVISSMPVLTEKDLNSSSYRGQTIQKLEDRMVEFVTAIQRTLDHPNIANIHLLYDKPDIIKYLQSRIKSNLSKLLFHKVGNARQSKTLFLFAYKYLQGRVIMINPADIYPGDGFELINKTTMANKKIFYALTRWGKVEKGCDMREQASSRTCGDAYAIMSCHDSFMFVPTPEIPQKAMHELDVMAQHYGVENMIIWTFKNTAKYRVLNPCKTLKIYHIHCSRVRDLQRKRISTPNNTAQAFPTDKLE